MIDKNEAAIKERLTKLINELSKLLPDPIKVSADLWRFAKMHDRRSYQLIRFCMAPESDYRTMYKAFVSSMIAGLAISILIFGCCRKNFRNVWERPRIPSVSWRHSYHCSIERVSSSTIRAMFPQSWSTQERMTSHWLPLLTRC